MTDTDIVWRVVEAEAHIVNLATGCYFSLNGSATEIWLAVQDGLSPEEAAQRVAATHDAEPAEVLADVRSLMQDLRKHGLLPGG